MRSVRFFVGNRRIRSVRRWRGKDSRRARWSCVWNTTRFAEGKHTLKAIARDGAGNHATVARRVFVTQSRQKEAASAPIDVEARTPISGTTYYVSPTGADEHTGASPDQAWRTVARVNAATLRPGDGVLFEAGASFDDAALMPDASGTAGAPIVFGTYGAGRAALPQGIWFEGHSHLAFEALAVAHSEWQGIQGTGDAIVVRGCEFSDLQYGVMATGSDWQIEGNYISRIGDSGLILWGAGHVVSDNVITDTGLDTAVTYGKHGIYLKASGAHVTGNAISGFTDSGVSARYHDSRIEHNTISRGQIGISWFQDDSVGGTSRWRHNQISRVTAAGIYVSPRSRAFETRESFVITDNVISSGSAIGLDLQATTGTYRVAANDLL